MVLFCMHCVCVCVCVLNIIRLFCSSVMAASQANFTPTRLVRIGTHDAQTSVQNAGANSSNFTVAFRNNRNELLSFGASIEAISFPNTFPNVKDTSSFIFRGFDNAHASLNPVLDTVVTDNFFVNVNGFTYLYQIPVSGGAQSTTAFINALDSDFQAAYTAATGGPNGDVSISTDALGFYTFTSLHPMTISINLGDTPTRVLGLPIGVAFTSFTTLVPPTASQYYPGAGWWTDTALAAAIVAAVGADPWYIENGGTLVGTTMTQPLLPQDVRWALTVDSAQFTVYVQGIVNHRIGLYQTTSIAAPGTIQALYLPSLGGTQVVYVHSAYGTNKINSYDASELSQAGSAKISQIVAVPITAPYGAIQTQSWDYNGHPQISYMSANSSGDARTFDSTNIDQLDISLRDQFGDVLDIGLGQHLSATFRFFLDPS
jgi:hypothetical protein